MRPAQGGGGEGGWEVLALLGAYAAGELEGEEAREAERLIIGRVEYRRLVESYVRMLVMLESVADKELEAPEAIASYALRRVYLSAFLRQAEQVVRGLLGDYAGALTFYLGLRPARQE